MDLILGVILGTAMTLFTYYFIRDVIIKKFFKYCTFKVQDQDGNEINDILNKVAMYEDVRLKYAETVDLYNNLLDDYNVLLKVNNTASKIPDYLITIYSDLLAANQLYTALGNYYKDLDKTLPVYTHLRKRVNDGIKELEKLMTKLNMNYAGIKDMHEETIKQIIATYKN